MKHVAACTVAPFTMAPAACLLFTTIILMKIYFCVLQKLMNIDFCKRIQQKSYHIYGEYGGQLALRTWLKLYLVTLNSLNTALLVPVFYSAEPSSL
jgi:hypothetical protein